MISDTAIIAAFDRGFSRAMVGDVHGIHGNPYGPTSEQELFEAWDAGFLEAQERRSDDERKAA